ncbi:hypothetical protein SAMN04487910_4387 [Aquimarina amphilecti]|uniref:Uncharacterized protein n=1 Tax=Aquimarina amphilecti TaxID=1038014 RepID=A0A1H7WCR8_AQUAM|nr:hypothetical protein [Aquimarina amphilecti]SEM19313.1 hypothetical protein SAMN04487910_4387 [Aquimarina amphilecti]
MRKEWYFKILITAFALLVVMQHQTVVPNQEIVLEFTDVEVTSSEAQNAIALVKKQLESIGVRNTRISKDLNNGKLKIAYYSDADVESIKEILSKEQGVALNHILFDQNSADDQFPFNKNSSDYNLDVYKIQKSTDSNTDSNGIFVLEVKQKQDRASGFYAHSFVTENDIDHLARLTKLAQKVNKSIAITIDNISYKIPEVRAGPIS